MNLEICPENISHLENDKNNAQAKCLDINESGYELTSRDPTFLISSLRYLVVSLPPYSFLKNHISH